MRYRIKLRKGFQRKLIEKTKASKNLSWEKLGNLLDISSRHLRIGLRYENILLPERIYKKLSEFSELNYDDYILERLDENWGRSKGGKLSKPKEREPKIITKKYSKELAELIGIILGDGNIWERKGGFYYVRICGHKYDEREYLLDYVKPLVKNIFNMDMDLYTHKSRKEIYLTKGSKDFVYTLKYFGLKAGDKIKNLQGIPEWIFTSKTYLKACIRGLIDTDGSVVPITGRNYSYILFSCGNPKLREDFSKATQILGYKIAKWNFYDTPKTYIGSKSLIRKYYKEIGFKNSKHIKRFKAPVV